MAQLAKTQNRCIIVQVQLIKEGMICRHYAAVKISSGSRRTGCVKGKISASGAWLLSFSLHAGWRAVQRRKQPNRPISNSNSDKTGAHSDPPYAH
jgi:hypothetical protein